MSWEFVTLSSSWPFITRALRVNWHPLQFFRFHCGLTKNPFPSASQPAQANFRAKCITRNWRQPLCIILSIFKNCPRLIWLSIKITLWMSLGWWTFHLWPLEFVFWGCIIKSLLSCFSCKDLTCSLESEEYFHIEFRRLKFAISIQQRGNSW